MAQVRSLVELAEAGIDDQWLMDAAHWRSRPIPTGQEAEALRVFHRAESAFAASRAVATVAVSEAAESLDYDGRHFVDCEVAIALHTTPRAGARQVARARQLLTELPMTFARLADGRISEFHAIKLSDLPCTTAAVELLTACEEEIWRLADPKDLAAGQLAILARRVMCRRDPHAFDRSHAEARRDADVSMTPDPTVGMAWISAYLPAADAATVMTAVSKWALSARRGGDERPMAELRAEGLRVVAERYLTGEAGSAPTSHGRPVEIQIAASLETIMGTCDAPGEVPGVGPVPAEEIRGLMNDARHRLITYDGDTGQLLDYGRTTYRAPAMLAGAVCATYQTSVGPGSATAAGDSDLDHQTPADDGGPTSYRDLVPLDRHWHRAKTHARFSYTRDPTTNRITWTTPLGQQATVDPYDWRLGP